MLEIDGHEYHCVWRTGQKPNWPIFADFDSANQFCVSNDNEIYKYVIDLTESRKHYVVKTYTRKDVIISGVFK